MAHTDKIIKVNIPSAPLLYDIFIENSLQSLTNPRITNLLKYDKYFIISQKKLYKNIVEPFHSHFAPLASKEIHTLWMGDGEKYKHSRYAYSFYEQLLNAGATRNSCIIAIGGGVVGDFAGYIASTYMRGIAFVQVPTTLLACVDSSIGGKVAVNLSKGKNMVGTFKHPVFTYICLDFLKSLHEEQWRCGLAEMFKHSLLVQDESVRDRLIEDFARFHESKDISVFAASLQRSIKIKLHFVTEDAQESSVRAALNLGHTTAHAIESAKNYKNILHGDAVSRGLVTMLYLSQIKHGLASAIIEKIIGQMQILGLPIDTLGLRSKQLWKELQYDKKNQNGKTQFVLMRQDGEVVIKQEIDEAIFNKAWKKQQELSHSPQ